MDTAFAAEMATTAAITAEAIEADKHEEEESRENDKTNNRHMELDYSSALINMITKNITMLEALQEDNKLKSQRRSKHKEKKAQRVRIVPEDTAPMIKKDRSDTTVDVYCKICWIEVGDIDTQNQSFEADVCVEAKWVDNGLNELSNEEVRKLEIGQTWTPKFEISNIINKKDEKSWIRFDRDDFSHNVVATMCWRVKGKFWEELELQHFPVDVQELTVQLTVEQPIEELRLLENPESISYVCKETFKDGQEWTLYEHCDIKETKHIDKFTEFPRTRSKINFICRAARKVGFFGWNVWFVMFLIILMTFLAYSIDPAKHNNRISITWTLLLTSIAFKMVANRSLPSISYLTFLDKYILVAIGFLCIQGIQNALLGIINNRWEDAEMAWMFDHISMIVIAIVIVVYHLVFGIYVYKTAYQRRKYMVMKDKRHKCRVVQLKARNDAILNDPQAFTVNNETAAPAATNFLLASLKAKSYAKRAKRYRQNAVEQDPNSVITDECIT